jgi:putative MATE family efflux protein
VNRSKFIHTFHQVLDYYRDREYFTLLFKIALPIALQSFILSFLNMVGTMMVGQLGETMVAAVGVANQIFFLMNLLVFGVVSGSAIFTAQFWGKHDVPNVRKVLSISVTLAVIGALAFFVIAELFPNFLLGIYSKDPAVVGAGSEYLRIMAISFVFFAITASYGTVLRSTGDVRTPLFVSMSALGLNTIMSYVLIFGKFGFPALGIRGAAVGIVVARVVECMAMIFITYRFNLPAAVRLPDIKKIDASFIKQVLNRVLPVTLNELLWAFGATAYSVIYARIGTDAMAAMSIAGSIEQMAMVLFFGISNACAILVGHRIGAGELSTAFRYAVRSLGLGVALGVVMGGVMLLVSGPILSLYKVSPAVLVQTKLLLIVIASFLWLRISNLIYYVGIFRSGGDTRFAFIFDVGTIWLVGVPMAAFAAFVLHLPVHLVYLFVMSDEITKSIAGLVRLVSRKWIHNLTTSIEPGV